MKRTTCLDCGAALEQRPGNGRGQLRCDACIREYKNASRRAIRRGQLTGRRCLRCQTLMPTGTQAGGSSYCVDCQATRAVESPHGKPEREPKLVTCATCGRPFEARSVSYKYCSPICKPTFYIKTSTGPRSKGRTGRPWRRLRAQVLSEETDCWLCKTPVDTTLMWPDKWSASIDHIIPISMGGNPLSKTNTRLAHLYCNMRRVKYRRPRSA